MLDLIFLAQICASEIDTRTMMKVIAVESGGNPHAIGVVGESLEWQPRSRREAMATIESLEQRGLNYSVGLGQVNKTNFRKYGLTPEQALDPCTNLRTAAAILKECFLRASRATTSTNTRRIQHALRDAFSCYYSGNFVTGYREGYVAKFVSATPVVPPTQK